jgi:hypothetical protein
MFLHTRLTRLQQELRLAVDNDDPRTRLPPAHPWRTQVGPVDIRPLHCDAHIAPAHVLERSTVLFQQQLYRAFVGVRPLGAFVGVRLA